LWYTAFNSKCFHFSGILRAGFVMVISRLTQKISA